MSDCELRSPLIILLTTNRDLSLSWLCDVVVKNNISQAAHTIETLKIGDSVNRCARSIKIIKKSLLPLNGLVARQ